MFLCYILHLTWCFFFSQVIDEEELQDNCENVGTFFLQELLKLRDEYEVLGDVRGKGLMMGIELVKSKVERHHYELTCVCVALFACLFCELSFVVF